MERDWAASTEAATVWRENRDLANAIKDLAHAVAYSDRLMNGHADYEDVGTAKKVREELRQIAGSLMTASHVESVRTAHSIKYPPGVKRPE